MKGKICSSVTTAKIAVRDYNCETDYSYRLKSYLKFIQWSKV